MAAPMTAAQFISALKREGLDVEETPNWRTHNRNHKGAWGPCNGVMVHHTAGHESGSTAFMRSGSSALPGPLCQGLIHKSGLVSLIGWGRANHAGGGDPDVLNAVIDERHPLPKTNEHDGSAGSVDGNARFVGYECVNLGNGKDPWPLIQLEAIARACAAVCRHHGWTVNSVIRHMDWSDWKIDPRGVDWTKMRARIAEILKGKPNATPISSWAKGRPAEADGGSTKPPATKPPTTKPPASKPKVNVSNVIKAYHRDRPARQGATSYPKDVKLVEAALLKLGFLAKTYASDGSFGTSTETALNAFRRSIGLKGADATGTPGKYSLTELGKRSGLFTV